MTDDIYTVTRHELLRTPGRRRNEFSAGRAPLVTDDETQGFGPSSTWIRVETGEVYTCLSAAVGAAVWRRGAGAEHDELQGLDQDDHLLYGIVYNTPNDPGTPPRGEAIWIDEDEDGGSGGAPAVHPHDASEVWYSNPGDLIPVTPLLHYQRPNEDGAFSVASPGSDLFQQIDEPGASNRGDFVALDAGGYFQVWFPAWTHSATDHIRRVQVWVDVANPAPTTTGAVYLRRKAEADLSASLILLPQSINGLAGSGWLTTNPFTGLGWEPDDLVNTGVQVNAGGALNGPQIYQLYIEVEYDASIDVDTALTSIQTELDAHEASPHGGGGGTGGPMVAARAQKVSGVVNINSTTWIDLVGVPDLVVAANAGDTLLIHVIGHFGPQAVALGLDAVTRVAGAVVNSVSGAGILNADYGFCYVPPGGTLGTTVSPVIQYVVQAGDIESGNVTLRMRFHGSGAVNRQFFGGTAGDPEFNWGVVNLRTPTPPGMELAYAQFTADVNFTGTEAAPTNVVSAPAFTADGTTRVCVEVYAPSFYPVSSGLAVVNLWEGSTDLGRLAIAAGGDSDERGVLLARRFLTPAAGSRTYHAKGWRSGTGTLGVQAGVGGVAAYVPGYIRVTVA